MTQTTIKNFLLNIVIAIALMLFALTACLPSAATEDEISQDHTAETDAQEDASESVSSIQQESGQSPFVLEAVDDTENGFILRGIFLDSIGLPENATLFGPFRSRDWWKITDADGQAVDFDIPETNTWGNNQDTYYFPWAIELKSKQYNWPLTITFETVAYRFPSMGEFEFDAGTDAQEGQTWDLNLTVEVGETPVQINAISRTENGYLIDVSGDFELIDISSPNKEPNGVESEVLDNGHKRLRLVYGGEVPAGVLTIELSSPVIKLDGPWQMQWKPDNNQVSILPPATPWDDFQSTVSTDSGSAILPPEPEACLTNDNIEQILSRPLPFPDLGGRIVVTRSDGTNSNIFIQSIDGTNIQKIGVGTWAALSRDGTHLAYRDTDGLRIIDFAAGKNIALGMDGHNIHWSSDGARIVYESGSDVHVANADGSGQQILDIGSGSISLAGWMPDNQTIVYLSQDDEGVIFRNFNLQNGQGVDLFVIRNESINNLFGTISPDGQSVVYYEPAFGENTTLNISRMDGSERKLVANLQHVQLEFAGISPNGEWVMLTLHGPTRLLVHILINPFTCQVMQLGLKDVRSIEDWIP